MALGAALAALAAGAALAALAAGAALAAWPDLFLHLPDARFSSQLLSPLALLAHLPPAFNAHGPSWPP